LKERRGEGESGRGNRERREGEREGEGKSWWGGGAEERKWGKLESPFLSNNNNYYCATESHRARDDLRCQFSPDPKEEIAAHLAGYGTIMSGKRHS
jgi:hypothetical protein